MHATGVISYNGSTFVEDASPSLTKIEPRKRIGFRFVFYPPLVSAEGFFLFVCLYAFLSSLGDGFMPRKTLDMSFGGAREVSVAGFSPRQTNGPSGLGGWLLCLTPTLPRGSCQEYREINRQRYCYTSI